jgi:sulfatase maturation enzyme AslB (radical SAM superfamily)
MKKISQTTCILPWIALDRNADTSKPSFAPCCLYESQGPVFHDFKHYWSSQELSQIRKEMVNGSRPAGCWKCWHDEDGGKKSMRQSVNESRLQPHEDELAKKSDQLKPLQIKLLAGASCNLACRMCQSHVSSKVHKVWQAIGKPLVEPYKYDFQAESIIRHNADHVRYIDLMGGEPFYNKRVQGLIQWLCDNKHSEHITIYVTTNGMLSDDKLVQNLKKFQEVVIIVSIDAVGNKHEYIRPGADWKKIVTNIDKLQTNGLNVIVQPVISAINILCLPELIQWCEEKKLHMTQMSLVHNPPELHPKNLPEKLKKLVDDRFSGFVQEEQTHDCVDFLKKLDAYWGTNILEIMPEWREVYSQNNTESRFEKDYDLYKRALAYIKKI